MEFQWAYCLVSSTHKYTFKLNIFHCYAAHRVCMILVRVYCTTWFLFALNRLFKARLNWREFRCILWYSCWLSFVLLIFFYEKLAVTKVSSISQGDAQISANCFRWQKPSLYIVFSWNQLQTRSSVMFGARSFRKLWNTLIIMRFLRKRDLPHFMLHWEGFQKLTNLTLLMLWGASSLNLYQLQSPTPISEAFNLPSHSLSGILLISFVLIITV